MFVKNMNYSKGLIQMLSVFNSPWGKSTAVILVAIFALLAIYHDTFFSMVKIWRTSETFAHCFLIFPISGYLVWRRRFVLARMIPSADYRPLLIFVFFGFGWLLANLGDVTVLQQYSLIAMIPTLTWIILGGAITNEISFPLLFLFFSVPFGEFLLPTLIDFTADFTVALLRATGIPVYREGTFFSIPSGDWSVIEACSGLRYLIASITLGCLFAYFNFRSPLRRLLFIIIAAIVPIFANGLRAYMIVMIAHISDMTLAVGVDHFIYGWVFFGIVMTVLFWIGGKWSEVESIQVLTATGRSISTPLTGTWRESKLYISAVIAITISFLWPLRVKYIEYSILNLTSPVILSLPEPTTPWLITEANTDWRPKYIAPDAEKQAFYTDGSHVVAVFVKYYRLQSQGKELVNSQNSLVEKPSSRWKMIEEKMSNASLGKREYKVLEGKLRSSEQDLLTWRWYWISGRYTANDYLAKSLHIYDKLMGNIPNEAVIILAIETNNDLPSARKVLQNFVDVMMRPIEISLSNSARVISQ